MEKSHIERRVKQMEAEGVVFHYGVNVGIDIDPQDGLLAQYELRAVDAVVLTGGAEQPRDLPMPGRDLAGVQFAMDFLPQQNKPQWRRAGNHGQCQADPRQRQACRGHRRRRHRLRLRRHSCNRQGALVGHPARDHAAAAGEGEQAADLAQLAAEAAHLLQP